MVEFQTDDLGVDYPNLLRHMLDAPERETRGGKTREWINASLKLTTPSKCIVTRKGFSLKFMHEEIAQLLAGVHDNERLKHITPVAASLITPKTAYGPRTWRQLQRVEKELRKDPLSRRAVVYIGNERDLAKVGKATANEMPCTCLWQFLVRDDELHMLVTMRSWDVVWGLGYDVPSFVAVQMAMAKALSVGVGDYCHHAGSMHIYERHWDLDVTAATRELKLPWLRNTMADTQEAARLRIT